MTGVFGSQVSLSDGNLIKADESYIRESIFNPQAKLVNGFGAIMPTFQGQISEEQLLQILAFIKSLQIVDSLRQTPGPAIAPPAGATSSPVAQPR